MNSNDGFTSVVGGWQCGKCGSIVSDPYTPAHTCDTETDPKVAALAIHLKARPDTIEVCRHSDDCFECESEPGEYRVLTESEREVAADDALESYIDECILPTASGALAQYFDRESWKRDALLSDGYGHTLSSYDGEEHEEEIDGVWFYIYRVN